MTRRAATRPLSRLRKPADLSLEVWPRELRRQFGREQRIAAVFRRGVADPAWRTLLRSELYEYQREGALFAARAGRCLIGVLSRPSVNCWAGSDRSILGGSRG